MSVSVRWHDEDRQEPDGATRRILAAWLVAQDDGDGSETPATRYLAYLGQQPRVTNDLKRECAVLYPEIEIDWTAVGQALEHRPFPADTTFDDLASDWVGIVTRQGLRPDDVDYRIGRNRRRPLRELRLLVEDPSVVARLERTSGSIFRYLVEFHPEYAYALIKLLLLLEGRDAELQRLESDEPAEGGAVAWADRVAHWRRTVAKFHPAG